MPCLEGKENNLNENDVQIEVESSLADNGTPAPAVDGSNLDDNNLPIEIDNISESEEQFNLHDLPLDDYQLTRDRERRQIKPHVRFDNDDFVSLFTYQDKSKNEPNSYDDAINCKDSMSWKAALDDEMNSLLKNKTWELVKRPKGQKLIDCKWIFKIKEGEWGNNSVRYKVILVAKGFTFKK